MKKIFIISFLILSGCGATHRDLNTDSGTMAEGDRLAHKEFYDEARKQYYRIKTEFPQSPLQIQADLKIAQTYYDDESYQAAANAYEDFIKTYPGRPEIPDALFKLGMCYVKQMPNTPQRDTRASGKVVDTFTRLEVEYPDYKDIPKAQQYILKAREQLVQKNYQIARFYQKMGDYDSAARRYGLLISQYPESKMVEESLAREIYCLKKAKKTEKIADLTKTFQEKYPNSKFKSLVK